MVGRALEAQRAHALILHPPAQRIQDTALTDAGLALQQHDLPFAVLRLLPAVE